MAGTVNKVILIARLGADPSIKYGQDGSAIANLSVATDEPEKQQDGTWGSRPEWHKLVAYGKTAEIIGSYVNKGSRIYVEGRLRTRSWEDANQVKRYTTEIVVKEIVLLREKGQHTSEQSDHDKAKANGYQRDQPPQQQKSASATTSGPGSQSGMPAGGGMPEDESIPF